MRMSAKQIGKWGKTRHKGRRRFIWVRGVLGFGGTLTILWLFSAVIAAGSRRGINDQQAYDLIVNTGTLIVLSLAGSYFWGTWVWKKSERQYLSQCSKDAS